MNRKWKSHDLCDLFNATLKGYLPPAIKDHAHFSHRDYDYDWVKIKKVMPGWPAGFDFNENNYELDGGWNETPKDQRLTGLNVFRNAEHARMLCFEGVRFSLNLIQSGITQGFALLNFWLESLWTVQCEFPPNTKSILQWAYASKDWIRSQFNAGLADFNGVNVGELIRKLEMERA